MASNNLFAGINAVVLEAGLGKARKKILCKKLEEKGGVSSDTFSSSVTHVLVGGTVRYDRVLSLLKVKEIDKHIEILQADWLSKCLAEAKLVETNNYKLNATNGSEVLTLVTIDSKHEELPAAEQCTPESSQNTPTKQTQHFKSPVKGSPAKKSPAGKHVIDSDDSDYVESDDDGHGVATDDDIGTHPPPTKKSKVVNSLLYA